MGGASAPTAGACCSGVAHCRRRGLDCRRSCTRRKYRRGKCGRLPTPARPARTGSNPCVGALRLDRNRRRAVTIHASVPVLQHTRSSTSSIARRLLLPQWRTLMMFLAVAYASAAGAANDYGSLVKLAQDWRGFEQPVMSNCTPDYGVAAMAAKGATVPTYRARLHELDTRGWPAAQIVDYRLIEAEMNGLDFDLTVRPPFARDPSFYATVFGERSDVPQHEGVTAAPAIDLVAFQV